MFYRDLEQVKEKMVQGGHESEVLVQRAAVAGIIDYYLTWALEAPKDEEE